MEPEASFDDFEEVRPKSKRNRAAEGTSDAVLNSDRSLIGIQLLLFFLISLKS